MNKMIERLISKVSREAAAYQYTKEAEAAVMAHEAPTRSGRRLVARAYELIGQATEAKGSAKAELLMQARIAAGLARKGAK